MNKQLYFLLLFLTVSIADGQNLVNNASFETYTGCPNAMSQIDKSVGWSSWSRTPDYFNSCSNSTYKGVGAPWNYIGYQYPKSGNAYAGFATYATGYANIREILATKLNQKLLIGERYNVKFFVSRAQSSWDIIGATNKLGAFFSTVQYSNTNSTCWVPINNFAHVYSDSLISDSTNWVLISGSFIADSAYQYVGFGNFFDDSTTTIAKFGSSVTYTAYYFIDDVSVSRDSASVTGMQANHFDALITIFPNPFTEQLAIKGEDNTATCTLLYDVLGRIVLQRNYTGSITLNTAQLSPGVYICEVRNSNGIQREKVIKE